MSLHDTYTNNQKKLVRFTTLVLYLLFTLLIYGTITLFILIATFLSQSLYSFDQKIFSYLSLLAVHPYYLLSICILSLYAFYKIYQKRRELFSFALRSLEIVRMDNPDIYNIVENTCISVGLRNPNIYLINDSSLNSFITSGSNNTDLYLSKGLVDKLSKKELTAVMAHEIAHVMNKDSDFSTFMVIITELLQKFTLTNYRFDNLEFVKIFPGCNRIFIIILGTTLVLSAIFPYLQGIYILVGPIILILLSIHIISYLLFNVFINLVESFVTKNGEYLADIKSLKITHDPESLITALNKISEDPVLDELHEHYNFLKLCILSPVSYHRIAPLFGSHPELETRIKVIINYKQ